MTWINLKERLKAYLPDRQVCFSYIWICAAVAVCLILDQMLKEWAYTSLISDYNGSKEFIPGLLSFSYAENTGAAFSILRESRWVFMLLSSLTVILLLLYVFFGKKRSKLLLSSLTLVLAGGMGNMLDRLFRTGGHIVSQDGYVIDMLKFEFIEFPIFNLADCFVSVGAALLILYMIAHEVKTVKSARGKE